MAANYWVSSQRQHWLLDRWKLAISREEDLDRIKDESEYVKLKIWFCHLIQRFARQLHLRQQVVATAFVYFKRFYANNSLRKTEPVLVLVTCVYLATKIEEHPVHIRSVTQEAKRFFQEFGGFPYDSSQVAEFEFYLLEELQFCLIVWHPYRPLLQICEQLGMRESGVQYAWFIVNDSYRTDVSLLYPPHMIALAAIYMTVVLSHADFAPGSVGDRSDMRQWFADLNIDIESIVEIVQDILSVYEVWKDWKEEKMMMIWEKLRR